MAASSARAASPVCAQAARPRDGVQRLGPGQVRGRDRRQEGLDRADHGGGQSRPLGIVAAVVQPALAQQGGRALPAQPVELVHGAQGGQLLDRVVDPARLEQAVEQFAI